MGCAETPFQLEITAAVANPASVFLARVGGTVLFRAPLTQGVLDIPALGRTSHMYPFQPAGTKQSIEL